jgi:hypothetical protein
MIDSYTIVVVPLVLATVPFLVRLRVAGEWAQLPIERCAPVSDQRLSV